MAPDLKGSPKSIDDSEETKQILEDLAELEHDIWVNWSRDIARTENISMPRLKRWKELWKPYSQLTEEQKEEDRILARKVLNVWFKSAEKQLIKHMNERGPISQ